ncbi:hypothetical protein [Colwellia hornerae]|uniref:Uncharacterized protein n=1 Tax=Colwellia hornerae TaxID=89402 RepID=A0A5C6QFG0_9GAMM|nr:hypothetical protein [Colwellia hornerae]TWX52318.1 hypothetical protein ESZ28_13045 [Colwellia hornerae]TWX57877.1 hypothetical protein ESZ26_13010 [Colwellia hornerae]TWX67579.1 hypothetical protein ESZ27_08880 [Colwellia hornerae]
MSMFKPTEFDFHNNKFFIPLDNFVVSKIKSFGQEVEVGIAIPLENIRISSKGFELSNLIFEIHFYPHCWNEFLNTLFKKSYLFTGREGIECVDITDKYESWLLSENSKIAVQKLKNSEISIAKLFESYPKLLAVSPLREYLSDPKNHQNTKKGPPLKYSENEYQLYCYSCHYYVQEGITYLDACAKTIENHPDLVPSTWKKGPPEDTLRTAVTKKYDKHPEYSQYSYRKERKKT